MANLIVTFTAAQGDPPREAIIPLEWGHLATTEQEAIGGASAATTAAATATQPIASILAEADCWIMIGSAPVAVAGSGRKMLEGERMQFLCRVGDKVAVIQA